MAKNYSAYEAAEVIMGTNVEEIAEVGSRYPVLTRVIAMANTDYMIDVLKALPKVSARILETGLKEINEDVETEEETEESLPLHVKPFKGAVKKTAKKAEPDVEEDDEEDVDKYDAMNVQQLYKEVCARGMSTKIKDRKRATMLEALRGSEPVEDAEEDWGEEEESEDPYVGKSAQELFKLCKERGIKAKPKMKADAYVKLLKKADETEDEVEEDDEDEWEL